MSETGSEGTAARIELVVKILGLVYSVICILWLVWAMIPEHRRRLIAMRVMTRMHSAATAAAFRTGHQAMALEISGCGENYSLPYALSIAAQQAARAYDKLRYTA